MSRVKLAVGLWFLLAFVVFNVRFDWQVRMAGHDFVRSQIARHQQHQATVSINAGFRPKVHQAALDGGAWFLAIALAGSGLTLTAAKMSR